MVLPQLPLQAQKREYEMSQFKVLVVDDAIMMRTIISNLLAEDPEVAVAGTAANGKEALDKLGTVQPDVILLDLEMPEMGGMTFLKHVKLRSKVPVIVLSSKVGLGSTDAIEARKLGAFATISKPSGAVSFDLAQKRGSEVRETIYKALKITDRL